MAIDPETQRGPDQPGRRSEAIGKTNLATIVGRVAFGSEALPPFARKNIAKTPLVGGQWRLGADGKYAIVVVDNQTAPDIPLGGKMEPIA